MCFVFFTQRISDNTLLSVMTSKISGWFVLSAVFIVAVFGLFFTFTERKTWPEHRIELSATDQRLIPPASTVWCEAIALSSDHPFVAYQVSQSPHIDPNHLNKQGVSITRKLGRSGNSFKLKYFLLKFSVLQISSCASQEGARLIVFKGEQGIQEYLQNLSQPQIDEDSDEVSSMETSSEEIQISNLDCTKGEYFTACRNMKLQQSDSSLISDSVMPVGGGESVCNLNSQKPVMVNITSDGFYVIVALNTDSQKTNHFSLRVRLDRSRYTIIKSGHSFDMCSLSTSCTIGLSFASDDSALVWIPEEPNAGRSSFTIRSRCKPRLAVFAILSVFLPLMFFVLVAFFVRADRGRLRRIYSRQSSHATPVAAADPLLSMPFRTSSTRTEPEATASEELPPPYHTVYEPPPPYSCLKHEDDK